MSYALIILIINGIRLQIYTRLIYIIILYIIKLNVCIYIYIYIYIYICVCVCGVCDNDTSIYLQSASRSIKGIQ